MLSGRKEYFITIAEVGNISKAAEILYISQPSLSQYITKLEKKLGIKLIERNYTPLRLTEGGKLYLEYAKRAEELERQFEKKLVHLMDKKNKISIGIPLQITSQIFPKMIENFIPNNMDYQLSIKGGTSFTLLDNFSYYGLDIAFVHTRKMDMPDIIFKTLSKEKLYLVCNQENELVKKRRSDMLNPIELSQEEIKILEKQQFTMLSKEYMLYKVCEEYFDFLGIFPQNTMELSNLDAILNYIIENGNNVVALIPEFALKPMGEKINKLAFLRIHQVDFVWYFVICRSKDCHLPSLWEHFWENAETIQWL